MNRLDVKSYTQYPYFRPQQRSWLLLKTPPSTTGLAVTSSQFKPIKQPRLTPLTTNETNIAIVSMSTNVTCLSTIESSSTEQTGSSSSVLTVA